MYMLLMMLGRWKCIQMCHNY